MAVQVLLAALRAGRAAQVTTRASAKAGKKAAKKASGAARKATKSAANAARDRQDKKNRQDDDRRKRRRRRGVLRWTISLAIVLCVVMALLMLGMAAFAGIAQDAADEATLLDFEEEEMGSDIDLTAIAARTGIPMDALQAYWSAALTWDVDWAILAGIGKEECDHGRSQLAGCHPMYSINEKGARGPMQFLGSTWRSSAGQYDLHVEGLPIPHQQEQDGYATDGNGDGIADPWQWWDATHAAARYLLENGYESDVRAAIYAYNGVDSYVDDVMADADRYRAAAGTGSGGEGLASANCHTGGTITVASSIVGSLQALLDAAHSDGLDLCGGGYRDAAQQIRLRERNCGSGYYNIYEKPSSECSPPTARPGTSMHEQGLAIDFDNCSTRSTACYQWLNGHAAAFGLYNFPREAWHWSVNGH